MRAERGDIAGHPPGATQIGDLAQPDRRIPDVAVIGKIDQREFARGQDAVERRHKAIGEGRDDLIGADGGQMRAFLKRLARPRIIVRHSRPIARRIAV